MKDRPRHSIKAEGTSASASALEDMNATETQWGQAHGIDSQRGTSNFDWATRDLARVPTSSPPGGDFNDSYGLADHVFCFNSTSEFILHLNNEMCFSSLSP